MIISRGAAALAAATALLVAGCAGGGWDEAANPARGDAPLSAPVTPAATPTPGARTPAAVPAALDFSARTLDGQEFRGTSLAGRPVVFWFWAPWCPKCRSEAPAVRAISARHTGVAFVGVAGLDTEAAMKEFVQRTGTGGIVQLSDTKGAVWTKLGVTEQSTFVFMAPDGSTTKASGPLDRDALDGHVRALLAG
ncbi:hypothetical protein Sme01_55470 [Sphaerisporangium melleum]|uniref:Thioredoxin domain-containing protein n=1 Tax=Sphaerisporangium melleum TaxID=321316 RepID=A0A917RPF2_9ACTN|nr:redoxin domain-containing protein [Sphaerisporangium melleum]GGL18152.1 hypothetical protein GCM10007964_70210 [Sphaerisporangium melleum]GII73071.1 hypothetical protein Sme01_55470 [Sphaerisporangium melleum]